MPPVEFSSRICFSLEFYATEEEADERAKQVAAAGYTYNGGFYHGTLCGRERGFDYTDFELGPLYAVSC